MTSFPTTLKKSSPLHHFIGNELVPSHDHKTFPVVAPATGEKIADCALGGGEDVDRAVAAAQRALAGPWRESTAAERARLLRKIAGLLKDHSRELAQLEAIDTGKPISETSEGDIPRAIANFAFFADLIEQSSEQHFVDMSGNKHRCQREPVGICGLITPWNLPLYLLTWKLAPALGQGNAVILKPAELTPLTATRFCELLQQHSQALDLPPGVINLVHGFGSGAGEALVRHPKVRALSFTGETATGTAIMAAAAPGLKKLSFELGGKGASVIFADADLKQAIPTSARAAFRNQGQICLAGSRILAHESVVKSVVDGIQAYAESLRLGDPLDAKTTMGSLISVEHRSKVQDYVDLARAEGQIVCGGAIPPLAAPFDRGAFLLPTVVTGVAQESRLIQHEIFGPIVTVQSFATEAEALAMLNGTPYGLSCSLWTQDLERAERAAARARTGMVWVNSWFQRHLGTAFGGMKQSGIGREGGTWSLDFFSEWKTITFGQDAHRGGPAP